MRITPIIQRVAWQRELVHYPATPARDWYDEKLFHRRGGFASPAWLSISPAFWFWTAAGVPPAPGPH